MLRLKRSGERRRGLPAVLALGLGFVVLGCDEPPTVVNAVPPGVDQRAVLAEQRKEKEEPTAIGEAGVGGSTEPKADVLPDVTPALATAKGETKATKSGVKYTTIKEGSGVAARAGQRVKVHYVGTLDDGRKFDSSRDRGTPAEFLIGVGKVIRGWDEAVPGMKIGEVRKLDIPASAGYGAQGNGPVPPNADLHFEIELVDVN